MSLCPCFFLFFITVQTNEPVTEILNQQNNEPTALTKMWIAVLQWDLHNVLFRVKVHSSIDLIS